RVPMAAPGYLVVRGTHDPMALVPAIRSAVQQLDSDVPVYDIQTFEELRESLIPERRLAMLTMLAFATLALILAVIGLYGVISYVVQLRTREIGIRLALGASRSGIRGEVLRSGITHAVIGIVI